MSDVINPFSTTVPPINLSGYQQPSFQPITPTTAPVQTQPQQPAQNQINPEMLQQLMALLNNKPAEAPKPEAVQPAPQVVAPQPEPEPKAEAKPETKTEAKEELLNKKLGKEDLISLLAMMGQKNVEEADIKVLDGLAAVAMQSLIRVGGNTPAESARLSYEYASEMVKERAKYVKK